MKKETRQLLVDAILDLASDEFTTPNDVAELARKSEAELVEELINIAEYFRDRD